ncbi:MAG: hypothetical protein RL417_2195, partial [Pseudomonadota bacterium]
MNRVLRSRYPSAFGVLLVLLLLMGCARRSQIGPWAVDDSLVAPLESERLLSLLAERREALRTFRGLFKTTVRRGAETSAFRQAIVFERPGSLRIEALPPHGALALYILIARSGEITALIPPERRAARGASSTALFRRYLDLPFREAEIMAIIAGELEADALRGGGEVRCGVGECTFQRKDRRYSWRFDKVTGALSGVTLRDPLKLRERVRVTYDDYRPVGERFLPGFIRVELI